MSDFDGLGGIPLDEPQTDAQHGYQLALGYFYPSATAIDNSRPS
jgi:hypothetical protein